MPAFTLLKHQYHAILDKHRCSQIIVPVPLCRAKQHPTDITCKAAQILAVGPDEGGWTKFFIDPDRDKFLETGSVIATHCVCSFLELRNY
jgi:hypothetical protein